MSETQFANELVVAGLRKLCTVPTYTNAISSYSQTHPLHVGLHSYTSGLERLCKLSIACHGFVSDGNFPPLRRFGHKISELLDAVEQLDCSAIPLTTPAPVRPTVAFDPDLMATLERFANGPGRYEHLDSLWKSDASVSTLDTWADLCSKVSASPRVANLLSMRGAVLDALQRLATDNDLEAAIFPVHEFVGATLHLPSIGVTLRLYEIANWVAQTLDSLTYYTGTRLPLLGEAVLDLRQKSDAFFKFSITLIEDDDVTHEELGEYFASIDDRNEDD